MISVSSLHPQFISDFLLLCDSVPRHCRLLNGGTTYVPPCGGFHSPFRKRRYKVRLLCAANIWLAMCSAAWCLAPSSVTSSDSSASLHKTVYSFVVLSHAITLDEHQGRCVCANTVSSLFSTRTTDALDVFNWHARLGKFCSICKKEVPKFARHLNTWNRSAVKREVDHYTRILLRLCKVVVNR